MRELMRIRTAGHTMGDCLIVHSVNSWCGDITNGVYVSHNETRGTWVMDDSYLRRLVYLLDVRDEVNVMLARLVDALYILCLPGRPESKYDWGFIFLGLNVEPSRGELSLPEEK